MTICKGCGHDVPDDALEPIALAMQRVVTIEGEEAEKILRKLKENENKYLRGKQEEADG